MDCLKVRDILRWLNQVPNAHVTILIDTEHDFVAKFGKQRQPEVVNIMTDPWSMLTTLNSSTVIYYLQPDVQAMAQYTDEDIKLATGMLTECFNFALLHCFVRKSKGQEIILSHQGFYEAISFYWHRRGRQHRLFVPAVRVSWCMHLLIFYIRLSLCLSLCLSVRPGRCKPRILGKKCISILSYVSSGHGQK